MRVILYRHSKETKTKRRKTDMIPAFIIGSSILYIISFVAQATESSVGFTL